MKIESNFDLVFEKNLNKAKIARNVDKPVFEKPLSSEEVKKKEEVKTSGLEYPADSVNKNFAKVTVLLDKNLQKLSSLSISTTVGNEMLSISQDLESCRDTILLIQDVVNSLVSLKQ